MKNRLQKEIALLAKWRKGILMVSPLEILLVIVVLGLVVITVATCIKSTKGPLSIKALKDYLKLLQVKFTMHDAIDAEKERAELEKLFIEVKSGCDRQVISGNGDLKILLGSACKQIKAINESKEAGTRGAWKKLKDLACGFDEFYFPEVV